jgi:hypothetical protein
MKSKQQLDELAKKLEVEGFIHVTGLPITIGEGNSMNGCPVVTPRRNWGKYDSNNGMTVAVLEDGRVYLGGSVDKLYGVLTEACPNGQGCGVPCSNGDSIHGYHLLMRATNPDWHGNGKNFQFHPEPDQAEHAYEAWMQNYHTKQVELAREQGKAEALKELQLP